MNHKLLVAVEGGVNSLATIIYAAQAYAGNRHSQRGGLVILHVLPPLPPSVEGADADAMRELADRLEAERRNAAEVMLRELKQRAIQEGVSPGLVTTEIAPDSGSVLDQILRAANAHGCDTIVVGRRAQSLIKEFLAGSVLERLLWKPIGFTVWIVEHDSAVCANQKSVPADLFEMNA